MAKFYPLKIKEIRKETEDCVSLVFQMDDSLMETFQFRPGQHLALKTIIEGEEISRNYSICTAPAEQELCVAVKKVEGGQFSTYANQKMKAGDVLDVMSPIGNFTIDTAVSNAKSYVAFAAGSGITPIMSMMKAVLIEEPESEFYLFYGNSRTDNIIFHESIEHLKNKFMDRLSVFHILSKEHPGNDLFFGHIDGEKVKRFSRVLFDPGEIDAFYLCGPEPMIAEVQNALLKEGVEKSKIHFELFTAPGEFLGGPKKEQKKIVSSESAEIYITQDGKTFKFELEAGDKTILEAAQESGANLPFACKGGVCCTCQARVLEGEVDMDVNYGLVPEMVEAGYILTCQSHPVSKKLKISFDE